MVEALVSANPIRDDAGRVVGALIVVRDITELTVLQQKMADDRTAQCHWKDGGRAGTRLQ